MFWDHKDGCNILREKEQHVNVQVFSERGKCSVGDHDAQFVLVKHGRDERLCAEHLHQLIAKDADLLSGVLVDVLTAVARPRAGQIYPR